MLNRTITSSLDLVLSSDNYRLKFFKATKGIALTGTQYNDKVLDITATPYDLGAITSFLFVDSSDIVNLLIKDSALSVEQIVTVKGLYLLHGSCFNVRVSTSLLTGVQSNIIWS